MYMGSIKQSMPTAMSLHRFLVSDTGFSGVSVTSRIARFSVSEQDHAPSTGVTKVL